MKLEPLSKNPLNNSILILGNGYVGYNLHQHLAKKFKTLLIGSDTLNYHDPATLSKFILNNGIVMVINCSGFTGKPNVDEAEYRKEDCWRLNVTSPLMVNQTCNKLGIKYLHISSGCIYTGYEKQFTEEDVPNFGLYDHSSFYSKTKHAFETLSKCLDNKIIRIRMPICNDLHSPRNYLKKIMNYPKLINYTNSKTYLPELCMFIEALINTKGSWVGQDIYNVVNPTPYDTKQCIFHLNNMNEGRWKFLEPEWVDIEELQMVAPRSNCVLDNSKADKIFKLSPEHIIMNMVCNSNNGIQAS